MLADDGHGLLYLPFLNYVDGSLDGCHEMLVHPHTVPGLGDGGAHVGTICDGSFPTTLLAYWGRDRDHDRIPLPFLVQRHCRDTARTVGLLDRGVIAPGYRADLNVVDFDRLRLHKPEIVHDLPANGRRLLQRADGWRHTIVAGHETYHDGVATDALPGRLVRGAQARTVRSTDDDHDRHPERRATTSSNWRPTPTGRAAHIGNPDDWTLRLTDAHHAELDDALAARPLDDRRRPRRHRRRLPAARPSDRCLAALAAELVNGRGFARIAALDVDRLGAEDASWIYWGIGMHLGEPWPQNAKGHLLGDVKDQGKAPDDPTARGNEIGGHPLGFHSDGSDLVGLLCIDSGVSGGESLVANAVGAYNALVRTRPDLAAVLYEPLPYDFRGEQREGAQPFYSVPAFTRHTGPTGDRLFVRYIRPFIQASQRHADAPRLTDAPDRGDGRLRRADQRPRQPGRDGVAARRHPVRQQLPRAARPPPLRRRHRLRSGPLAQATVVGHRHPRPGRPPRPVPTRRRHGPLGIAPHPCLTMASRPANRR